METDPAELRDVAADYPEVVQRMTGAYEDWSSEMGVVKMAE